MVKIHSQVTMVIDFSKIPAPVRPPAGGMGEITEDSLPDLKEIIKSSFQYASWDTTICGKHIVGLVQDCSISSV